MSDKHEMSKSDASRIQSTQAQGGKDMSSSGFAAHAQSAGDKNENDNATKGGNSIFGAAFDKGQTQTQPQADSK